ncbi:hypothetical protein PS2_037763 [Malus domestica]
MGGRRTVRAAQKKWTNWGRRHRWEMSARCDIKTRLHYFDNLATTKTPPWTTILDRRLGGLLPYATTPRYSEMSRPPSDLDLSSLQPRNFPHSRN